MPYLRHLGLETLNLDALFKASRPGNGVGLDALNLGCYGLLQGTISTSTHLQNKTDVVYIFLKHSMAEDPQTTFNQNIKHVCKQLTLPLVMCP